MDTTQLKAAAELDRAATLLVEAAAILKNAENRLDAGYAAILRRHVEDTSLPLAERITLATDAIYKAEGVGL